MVAGGGGGGGSDYADSEQTENLNEDTGGEDTSDYDSNEGGRSVSAGYVTFELDAAVYSHIAALRGRKIEGTNADGSPKMGKWVHLVDYSYNKDANNGDPEITLYDGIMKDGKDGVIGRLTYRFFIPAEFVEFGFEFDNKDGGTDYPYSGVFWTVDRGKAEKIRIQTAGNKDTALIRIKVNNTEIFSDTYCYPHIQYDWDAEDKIVVRTTKTKDYLLNVTRFYARKSSTAEWEHLIDTTEGSNKAVIDPDYVEFGFEFDIDTGTKWPYSGMFWTAGKSEELKSKGVKVEDINIEMTGSILSSNIYIYVNGQTVIAETNCKDHTQYDWSRNVIKVVIANEGSYNIKQKIFKARKEGGSWETLLDEGVAAIESREGTTYYFSFEYVDFGFAFDILGGWDWPYDASFWKKKDHPNDIVEEIYITTGGWSTKAWIFGGPATIDIEVKGRRNGIGDTVTLHTYSNHNLKNNTVWGGWHN